MTTNKYSPSQRPQLDEKTDREIDLNESDTENFLKGIWVEETGPRIAWIEKV
jgi:hypothetical protein